MLRHLNIRDFAIIDRLELAFDGGFTVLTGETGAGKSILIDAIGLLLGDRADSAMVRAGAAQAELAAEFSLAGNPPALDWLQAQSLSDADQPDAVLLRRVVSAEGRSRAFINGAVVPLTSLRELGEYLIEIHGQHEHQRLLRADLQRTLLDEYGGHDQALDTVAHTAREWQGLEQEIEAANTASRGDPQRLDYLRHQVHELQALQLQAGEIESLDDEQRRLAHAGRMLQDGGHALDALYGGDDALHDRLATVKTLLDDLAQLHPEFDEPAQLVAAAQIQTQEAAGSLRRLLERLELDPERLAEVERRMAAIHDLARKHRVRPQALREHLAELQRTLEQTEHAGERVAALLAQRAEVERAYREAAATLTLARLNAARRLGTAVSAAARELGMPKATLKVEVGGGGRSRPSPHGDDEVRIDFSANPGQPPRPLSKVASGGELSRVSLAIQVVVSVKSTAAAMIFDEVDAGVGGGTAEIVGAKLRALGNSRQVLCVTHLPQVAAQGQHHYSIDKEVRGGQTYTRVRLLKDAERVDELSRMLGGIKITDQTRAHAREMLARAPA